MKIKYFGTAAAEGIPALFCKCDVCKNARSVGGKEVKTRSQSLIDGTVLIDFPADTYMHILNNDLYLDEIHTLIITHTHSDHFYPQDFWCRAHGIAYGIEEKPLNVFVTEGGYDAALDFLKRNSVSEERVLLHKIEPFVPFESDGHKFIPLSADHDPKSDPVIYIIEKDGKSMLYANDTGYFPEKTWEYLAQYGKKFNCVSLDCTLALALCRYNHMDLATCKEVYAKLCEMNLCDDSTVACINHFSHNGKATHEQLALEAEKAGFAVSYDGLELEF